jgi:quinol monooxygenase YgiN
MVWEHAEFELIPGTEETFEALVRRSRAAIAEVGAARSITVHRAVEHPSRYVLLVEWPSVGVHRAFVATPEFAGFFVHLRELISAPGRVFHTEVVELAD